MMGRPGGAGRRPGPGGGPMGMGMGAPTAKPQDFRGTLQRLLNELRPEVLRLVFVAVFAVGSVAFLIIGPRLLGEATNVIFDGIMPPAPGVDMGALAQVLLTLIGVYTMSAFLGWVQAWIMAGVTQRTVYRLRGEVDRKLGRLPLRYFDDHPRGDILSRVTNDIDNIGQTLQQTLTQLITAVLTIIGVLAMMIVDQPRPGPHLDTRRAGVTGGDTPDRATLAAPVRGPVGLDRDAQRAHRGDAHRTRHREGLRAPGRGHREVRL